MMFVIGFLEKGKRSIKRYLGSGCCREEKSESDGFWEHVAEERIEQFVSVF